VEGTATNDVAKESGKLGFQVCETEAEEMLPAVKLTLLYSLSWYNAFMDALKRDDEQSRLFVYEFIKLYSGAQIEPGDNYGIHEFIAIQNFERTEIFHTLALARGVGLEVEVEELNTILGDMDSICGIPPSFKALIDRVLKNARDDAIIERIRMAFKTANDFFLQNFNTNVCPTQGIDTTDLDRLTAAAETGNPLAFSALLNPMVDIIGMYREIYLAYCVVRESFDIGILNVGENHSNSRSFRSLLLQTGIDNISVVPIQPAALHA